MLSERQNAYLKLIRALLECPSGMEPEILNANRDLIDAGLVQIMVGAADMLEDRQEKDRANFLRNMAAQLAASIRNNSSIETLQEDLLLQVLQIISKDGDRQEVYQLLSTNLDKLDDNFALVLRRWVEVKLSVPAKMSDAAWGEAQLNLVFIRLVILGFCSLIQNFPQGDNASKQEIVIAGYESILQAISKNSQAFWKRAIQEDIRLGKIPENITEEFIKDDGIPFFPLTSYEDWAEIQDKLGDTYYVRLRGEKADNLKKVISCYQEALKVYTLEDFPVEWATTNLNLGVAYCNYHQGNRAANVKEAIACFENALQVFTRENYPKEWATAQNNLAALRPAFSDGLVKTSEQEIEEQQKILQTLSPETFPEEWANSQYALGNIYLFRVIGDRADNLEKAIEFYQKALQVFSREAFPREWAAVQYGLGMVCRNRIVGKPEDNIEQAIRYFQEALQVDNYEKFPEQWARTQHNLAKAYRERRRGNPLENIEKAIQCFKNALLVRTPKDFPQQWAVSQHQLGILYFQRYVYENKIEDLTTAISCYENALKVLNRQDFPDDWARTQGGLSKAYTALYLKRGRTENWEKAVASAQNHLQVFTRESSPRDHVEGLSVLNEAYLAARRFRNAYDTLERAIDTVELLRGEIISGDAVKQKLAEQWNLFYQSMVVVCLQLAKKEPHYQAKAIEYVERSKARNLVELLATRDLYPKGNIGENVLKELNRLRREIASEERRVDRENIRAEGDDIPLSALSISNRTRLNQLRQELDTLIAREIQPVDPNFTLTQKVKSIPFSQIQGLLPDNKTAIIEWYITGETFITFIITRQNPGLTVWQPPPEERQTLINWSEQYLQDYRQKQCDWQEVLPVSLNRFAEVLHLDEILLNCVPSECERLILIPHRHLHLFPLHALPVGESVVRAYRSRLENNGQTIRTKTPCLLDIFPRGVSYAPSCQLLQLTQNQKRPDFSHFFAVQNPTEDLTYTDIEVATIQQRFQPNDTVLVKSEATKENLIGNRRLRTAHCTHFSCHGVFNFESPLKSALILAGAKVSHPVLTANVNRYIRSRDGETIDQEKCLTLGEIFSLDLRQCRLVALSACETGLADFTNQSDEYISLPSGFLYAGSLSVVSSQWKVNDSSTAFLMIKFYQNMREGLSVAVALNSAQLWLRDVTKAELEKWMQHNQLMLQLSPRQKAQLDRLLYNASGTDKPFSNPYYWSCFCAVGQ
ncbi:CHAT domain-containing protein [Aerosakkonemataceae cyanobacterium BLCC-F50]|uniref:CHAT domain-containing protein n=1 Tax=Floridaenema flaviceps BLCC-F50 TaxID=3153642 RepID=A0ABV4XIS1_9CYAN